MQYDAMSWGNVMKGSGTAMSFLRKNFDKLGVRFVALLAVALLPLMIVSIVRSQSVLREAVARSQAALAGEALRVVRDEVTLIEGAMAVARSLSYSVQPVLDDPETCNRMMQAQLIDTSYSFAGFYDTTGFSSCSSAGNPFDLGLTPAIVAQVADPRPVILVNENAPVLGTSVIYASYPVFTESGALMGFTAISVPHEQLHRENQATSGAVVLTLGGTGQVLTAPKSLEVPKEVLPAMIEWQDLVTSPTSFQAVGRDGMKRLYAFVPIIENELYALATWPEAGEFNGTFYLKNPSLFPALMWLASLVVAWMATSIFVSKHVIRLRKSMLAFADTRRVPSADEFSDAPNELRDVSDSFIGMTDRILRDEAKIEEALRQKDILLREVHHRVKNNLQLIASIMSMQIRKSRSQEVKSLLRSLHDRVNSLATIHRNLYQTSGQADVTMQEHLDEIVQQVMRMGARPDREITLSTDFAELTLNTDQAVPLSLFVTEAITNALKYIGAPDGQKNRLRVNLKKPALDIALVEIENSLSDQVLPANSEASTGLGSELMDAFSQQLEGNMTRTQTDSTFKIALRFPIDPLTSRND
tara:strand:+ start:784 stop:2541 length:1758 start_codon:yes stop_codon:yes gene_type:complete